MWHDRSKNAIVLNILDYITPHGCIHHELCNNSIFYTLLAQDKSEIITPLAALRQANNNNNIIM